SINNFDAAGGIELKQCRRNSLNVFELAKLVGNFDWHRRAAEAEKNRSGGRLEHDVRTDAFDALCGFRKQARGETDDEDNQSYLHGDGDDADQGAYWAMKQIAQDQFAHHGLESFEAGLDSFSSPTRTISAPAGCCKSKRSARRSSFS